MGDDIRLLLLKLESAIESDKFLDVAANVVEQLEQKESAFEAVEPVLRLLETHETVDFGTPGPLVHFVEHFYGKGYEEKLVQSIRRKPTSHTCWMLNRVINGSKGETKLKFLRELETVLKIPNLDPNVRSLVEGFREMHMSSSG